MSLCYLQPKILTKEQQVQTEKVKFKVQLVNNYSLLLLVSISVMLMGCVPSDSGSSPINADLKNTELEDSTSEIQTPGLGAWPSYGRDYSEQRFFPESQINTETVGRLGLEYSLNLDANLGISATPLLINGMLIFPMNWNIVLAVDALTGEEVWRFDPQVPRAYTRSMGGASSRGVAAYDGKIIVATMDGRLMAVDDSTGEKIWETDTFDGGNCKTIPGACFISGAPRVAKGKVFIGFGGAENNARGYVSTYDVENGDFLWRFYIVPGDRNDPAHPEHPEMLEAIKTWGDNWNDSGYGGGGTVWDSMVYDAEYDQLIIGTGNGGPMFARHLRAPDGGDLLYLSSIIALDMETGRMKWYYQQVPGEQWDYTATQSLILADLETGNETRKVVMQAPKNGFFYVIDRANGSLLSAEKFATVTWAERIDMETGRPVESEQADYRDKPKWVSPGGIGAANWQPSSYNPVTGLVYISGRESTLLFHLAEKYKDPEKFKIEPGFPNNGFDVLNFPKLMAESWPPPIDNMIEGYLKAFDPVKGEMAWQIPQSHFWNGGVLSTAGNLVFLGGAMGQFEAYNANDGERLWSFDTYSSIIASPISYLIEGKQYIAILTGTGMASSAFGYNGPTASYVYGNQSKLLVFSLDAKTILTEPEKLDRSIPEPPEQHGSAEDIAKGNELYHSYCANCHGATARSASVMPDLRQMDAAVHSIFKQILLDGVFVNNGMASFDDVLDEKQIGQIHSYLIERTTQDYQQEQSEKLDFRGGI